MMKNEQKLKIKNNVYVNVNIKLSNINSFNILLLHT